LLFHFLSLFLFSSSILFSLVSIIFLFPLLFSVLFLLFFFASYPGVIFLILHQNSIDDLQCFGCFTEPMPQASLMIQSTLAAWINHLQNFGCFTNIMAQA
jgi:hypothetical protein